MAKLGYIGATVQQCSKGLLIWSVRSQIIKPHYIDSFLEELFDTIEEDKDFYINFWDYEEELHG